MAAKGKLARVTAYVLGVSLLMILSALLFARYELRRMRISFSRADGESAATFVKGMLAQVLVAKQIAATSSLSLHEGLLNAYERDPESLQKDAKLFDAWTTSRKLGQAVLKNTTRGNWISSSAAVSYVSAQDRVDPWQHTFCLLRRGDELLIMSGGPTASISLTCKDVEISGSDLAKLPHGKLLQSPAGYFLLS
jgi:hypothetical protein